LLCNCCATSEVAGDKAGGYRSSCGFHLARQLCNLSVAPTMGYDLSTSSNWTRQLEVLTGLLVTWATQDLPNSAANTYMDTLAGTCAMRRWWHKI